MHFSFHKSNVFWWINWEYNSGSTGFIFSRWSVVEYSGEFYTLTTLDSFDSNLDPIVSDNWGAVADYDPAYNTYELSDHEYVVYKGRVFSPETDVNADIPQAGQHFVLHDPRNPNLKRHMVRLAVYELTKLIAPNNVSVVRIRDLWGQHEMA